MIVKKIRGTEIRRYQDDDGRVLGIAGTVEELERVGVLLHESGEKLPPDSWCCIDDKGNILDFVGSREAANSWFL